MIRVSSHTDSAQSAVPSQQKQKVFIDEKGSKDKSPAHTGMAELSVVKRFFVTSLLRMTKRGRVPHDVEAGFLSTSS